MTVMKLIAVLLLLCGCPLQTHVECQHALSLERRIHGTLELAAEQQCADVVKALDSLETAAYLNRRQECRHRAPELETP
jgi:hypothetical protein